MDKSLVHFGLKVLEDLVVQQHARCSQCSSSGPTQCNGKTSDQYEGQMKKESHANFGKLLLPICDLQKGEC